MKLRGPTPDRDPAPRNQQLYPSEASSSSAVENPEESSSKIARAKAAVHGWVKEWVTEEAKTKGFQEANRVVADNVSQEILAREVVERAKRLQSEMVEINIPNELLEEAARQVAKESSDA
eukprot:11422066-Karenia_brevis.AAC.1